MGTPGHMAHPFDSERVQTGQDLIKYFRDIKEFLELNPGSLKIDGINVSFKLITTEDGKKEFRMDRGTTHTESVIGMDAAAAYKKWPEGHGMPPAIKTLLEIFNQALPSIQYELKDLGMWDNPSKFFNTEYVAGKTNVQKYDRNFLAIHGINQFYEKKAPKAWVASGKSMDRKGLKRPTDPETGKPIKGVSTEVPYNRGALESLIKKVEPFASQHGFEIYGDVPTELAKEINFAETLGSPFTIQMTKEDQETHSIEEWLKDAQNPRREKVTKSDGTQVDAISKDIYMAVLNEIPLTEYLQSPEDVKRAISGALFNHTTRMLGNDVKSALDSSMGSVADHEGVVLRGMEEFPVKVTGEFIVGGMQTAFREGVIKEVEELKGIKDVEEELGVETVDPDEPETKRKVALIPGGFKPPHRGHLALVTHYLDEVAPDGKVILYMGSGGDTPRTIHGEAITFEDAMQIWKIYLNNENIAFPNEVLEVREVKGGPIGAVIDYVTEADPDKEVIYLGAGEKDAERWKFMMDNPKYNPNNVQVFIEPVPNYNDMEGAPMSATNFRKAIESGEEELIKSYMPESSHDSYREIMDVFEGRLKEVQQPLGIFLRLIEETINEQDERMYQLGEYSPTQLFGDIDRFIMTPEIASTIDKVKDQYIKSYKRGEQRKAWLRHVPKDIYKEKVEPRIIKHIEDVFVRYAMRDIPESPTGVKARGIYGRHWLHGPTIEIYPRSRGPNPNLPATGEELWTLAHEIAHRIGDDKVLTKILAKYYKEPPVPRRSKKLYHVQWQNLDALGGRILDFMEDNPYFCMTGERPWDLEKGWRGESWRANSEEIRADALTLRLELETRIGRSLSLQDIKNVCAACTKEPRLFLTDTDREAWKILIGTYSDGPTSFIKYLSCKDPAATLKAFDLVVKREPTEKPTKMVAENFLNIVEETINETPVSDMTNMYGFASGNLSNITPGGFEVESEEEKPTAKDALEAMIGAIKKVAEENGINIDDEALEEISAMGAGAVEGPGHRNVNKKEQTSLIREVEDYLFKMLGVNL